MTPQLPTLPLRLVAWNIQQGGADRAPAIAERLTAWRPDLCIFSEFSTTDGSAAIRTHLADLGLTYSLSTVQDGEPWQPYGLLIASRWPLTPLAISLDGMPPQCWLSVRVERETPLLLGGVYVPNRDEFEDVNKYAVLNTLVALANARRDEPMIIAGDFNTGRIGLDETSRYFDEREDAFMRAMEHSDWASALRLVHGDTQHASYWNPRSGNGFLIDHAFVAPTLAPQVTGCTLEHEPSVWPSDHAALIVDLTR